MLSVLAASFPCSNLHTPVQNVVIQCCGQVVKWQFSRSPSVQNPAERLWHVYLCGLQLSVAEC